MKSVGPATTDERRAAGGLQFGEFTLDLQRRGLYRGSERLHLTAKPLETLIALVEHRGETLDKRRLLDLVWGGTFVTEGTLVQAIREIRRVLDDDKEDPVFVQTVPRQGYRFVGRVIEEAVPSPAPPATVSSAGAPSAGPAQASGVRRSGWMRPGLVLAALAVAGAIGGVWLQSRRTTDRTLAAGSPLPLTAPLRQMTYGMVSAVKPAFSPDGKVLLYVSSEANAPGVLDLHVMPAGSGNAWRITDKANASGDLPVFWPDGTAVVFSRYRSGQDGSRLPDLWRVAAFGGPMEQFLPRAGGAGFSPDGRDVAYTKYLETGRPLWISRVDALETHRGIAETGYVPRWSPDGRWLAYTTSDPEGGPGHLLVLSGGGGSPRQLTDTPVQFYGLAWTADSRAIIVSSRRSTGTSLLWRFALDGGEPQLLLAGVGTYTAPSVSPDGRTLVFCFTRPSRNLVVADDLGARGTRSLTVDELHRSPRLSPSGARLASVLEMPGTGGRVYTTDVESGERREIGEDATGEPAWIDEDELAYVVKNPGGRGVINALQFSTSRVREIARFEGDVSSPAFRRHGQDLALVLRTRAGESQVLVKHLDTGRQRVLVRGGQYEHVRWVPGRDAVSWSGPEVAGDPGSNGIWMAGLDVAVPRHILRDGYHPVWSGDGAALFYSRPREMDDGLWRLDVGTGQSTRLRPWQRVPAFDVAGSRLVYVEDSGRSQIHAVALK